MTLRLSDAVSLDLFVRLLATVPAADTLLADPGMTEPVLPFTPAEIEALTDDAGALTPFLVFLGLVSDFAKTEPVFESALCDLRDPMIAGYVCWAERVAAGMPPGL